MTTVRPELKFERLLAGLERDLLGAADQEILEAASELGMNPILKGSAALFGVTFTIKLDERARARVRSQNLWFAEASPRTPSKKSSGSTAGSHPKRRSKRGTPPAD
ncbi:MAG: hypothetical protein ACREUT_22230 [Steroidobacteraceae bacterium]